MKYEEACGYSDLPQKHNKSKPTALKSKNNYKNTHFEKNEHKDLNNKVISRETRKTHFKFQSEVFIVVRPHQAHCCVKMGISA